MFRRKDVPAVVTILFVLFKDITPDYFVFITSYNKRLIFCLQKHDPPSLCCILCWKYWLHMFI